MCTYNLSLSDSAVDRIRPAFKDDAAIQVWLQQQLEMLVMQFCVPTKQEIDVLTVDKRIINNALHSGWKDFEDSVIAVGVCSPL